jgi:diadenosine tetraphosphate (Ap4A) HIT family hydrolase
MANCGLCDSVGGRLLWQDSRLRVVCVDEPGYIGYCRVIWKSHVAEMTELEVASRMHCMRVVFTVESLLREFLKPDKINLASLGNLTPHLHWHVIARFRDDPHFPQSIWSVAQREVAKPPASRDALQQQLAQGLAAALHE